MTTYETRTAFAPPSPTPGVMDKETTPQAKERSAHVPLEPHPCRPCLSPRSRPGSHAAKRLASGVRANEATAGAAAGFTLVEVLISGALLLIFAVSFISLLTQHTAMQLHAMTYYEAATLAKNTLENSAILAYDDLPGLIDSNRVDSHGTPMETGTFLRMVDVDPGYGATLSPSTELTRISVAVAYQFKGVFREPLTFETLRWRD